MPGPKAPEDQRRDELLAAAYRVAARDRLGGLTTRAVAKEAGVSNGLVFFHFGSREGLVLALLDRLLATTVLAPGTSGSDDVSPVLHLLYTIERDVEGLPGNRDRVALMIDFWVMGTQHPDVRLKIRKALDDYREAYVPLTAAAIASEPGRYPGVTPESLAAVATGFIEGCALQVVMDPERFDVPAYLSTLRALVLYDAAPTDAA
ncbi:TetR/AcrR family transcriptional regulator [Rubrivirga sp. IMCC43871]|uniref:TetR/AcrR family transcriptional regulator n=1 Tax=Rubrivirga sp. IMCC43871 TaxID=3391575 RepID=UPI00398FDBF5